MQSGLRTLVTIAVVAIVIGAGATLYAAPAVDAEALRASFEGTLGVAFADVPWSFLPALTGLTILGASVLSIVEWAMTRPRIRSSTHTHAGDAVGLRQVLGQVRARVEEVTQYPPDVVQGWEELVRGAVSLEASDIHVSPTPDGLKVTYRVHGDLHDVISLSPDLLAPLVTRLKVLARLDTTQRTTPQDGRLSMMIDAVSVEARVSTLPTESGERIVLRLVRGGRSVPELADLGFSEAVHRSLSDLLARPQGLLFVTGPVGSGKTTTLYAGLKHISATRGKTTNCVTLEDPIELELPFATQTQINPKTGMTFASTLRSVLRQDPNVLMVGEIRDRETAEIAMQAGLTGHVILTTVHGQSAAGAFARLVEMGVEPFILTSSTLGCLSQRLVRTLCTACRRPGDVPVSVLDRFTQAGVPVPDGTYYEPVGCRFCESQGFSGRVPIGELLIVNDVVRKAVNDRNPTSEIEKVALREGMVPLLVHGLERARRGDTSLIEVLRVAG
ncbi:MAG: type II/IV secretion system protein [Polyangiaceae bacterium]|nr:type II/IV secretion system protein [Polyangiaceae bacterium]